MAMNICYDYRVVGNRKEPPMISSVVFAAVAPSAGPNMVLPGFHVRVRLGEETGPSIFKLVAGDTTPPRSRRYALLSEVSKGEW